MLKYQNTYYYDHKDKILQSRKERYSNDLEYKINTKLYANIRSDNKKCRDFEDKKPISCEEVLNIINKQNNKCCVCNSDLQLKNYSNRSGEQFSINRKDNKRPHILENIEICCWKCHRHLKRK
jgi:hypothetical protein